MLCLSCHMDKSSSENEQGQYIKPKETLSFFQFRSKRNYEQRLITRTRVCWKGIHQEEAKQRIFCIDINNCRSNILKYSKFDYCLFTCFDHSETIKSSTIVPGLYYIETDNYFPLRGNSWVYHDMVSYCLENGIIKLDN